MGSKTVQDLIGDNVTISWNGINGSVKGDVKHVTGYELFPEEEQDGNFFPIVLDSSYKGKEITVRRKGGTAKTQADTEWIVRLSDGKATEYDVSSGGTKIAHLDFAGANLASAPLMVSRKKKS